MALVSKRDNTNPKMARSAFPSKSTIEKNMLPDLYISTMGYIYQGCEDGKFYPRGMPERDRLSYYASKFDSVLITSTFYGQPRTEVYSGWLRSVSNNTRFKFIVSAPKLLTFAKTNKEIEDVWKFFWEGNSRRGGCNMLHEHDKLGCILIEFPSAFFFSQRNVNKLKHLMHIIPSDIKIAAEFRHWSWWENRAEMESIFTKVPNWCIATPYVENGLVESGWAGNLPSTRVYKDENTMPIHSTTDFVFLHFYGTMGRYLGSYDDNMFLERIVSKIKESGANRVFCSFSNTDSSYCYPLPMCFIMGLPLCPKIKDLPSHTSVDLPCCLHDAQRFKTVWQEIEDCPYMTDDTGYIQMEFV